LTNKNILFTIIAKSNLLFYSRFLEGGCCPSSFRELLSKPEQALPTLNFEFYSSQGCYKNKIEQLKFLVMLKRFLMLKFPNQRIRPLLSSILYLDVQANFW
jgi:hypothetical protein